MKTVIYKYITSKKFNISYKRYLGSRDVTRNIITTVGAPELAVQFNDEKEAIDFINKYKTLKYFVTEAFLTNPPKTN